MEITPLLTVGDVLPSGYRFEAIPDGISVRTRGQGRVDLFVNHETSKVPFPYVTAAPTAANGENDFDNAQVSQLILNQHSAGVLNGSFAIASSFGLPALLLQLPRDQRRRGSTGRSSSRTRSRPTTCSGRRRPGRPRSASPAEREAGLVVALDVQTGKHHPIYGMGRHNHENSVPIPGYGYPVVLSGDDTFTSGPLTGVLPAVTLVPRSRSSTPTSHRARTRCWPTRATSGPSSPTRRA